MQLTLKWDDNVADNRLLSNLVGLGKNGQPAKSIQLGEADNGFQVMLKVTKDQWKEFESGPKSFNGQIQFEPANTTLGGDVNPANLAPPLTFRIQQPPSPWPYIIGIAFLLLLVSILVIRKINSDRTPPVFNASLDIDNQGQVSLRDKAQKINGRSVQVIVGPGDDCQLKIPALGEYGSPYFSLLAEKGSNKDKADISIQPNPGVDLFVDNLPCSVKTRLLSGNSFTAADHQFTIYIA